MTLREEVLKQSGLLLENNYYGNADKQIEREKKIVAVTEKVIDEIKKITGEYSEDFTMGWTIFNKKKIHGSFLHYYTRFTPEQIKKIEKISEVLYVKEDKPKNQDITSKTKIKYYVFITTDEEKKAAESWSSLL